MATGGSAATGASQTASSPPVVAGITKWYASTIPDAQGQVWAANDPNNTGFSLIYRPGTTAQGGGWSYVNNKTGQYASALKTWATTPAQAVQDYENALGNAPLATLQGFLGGYGFGKAPAASAATTTATTSTTTPATTTTATDPVAALIADLPSLIGDNSADPSTQSTQQPEVLPTTSGGGTSAASPVVPLLLIGVAIALGFWWYKTHHKKAAAA